MCSSDLASTPAHEIGCTGDPAAFREVAARVLGDGLGDVRHVELVAS